MLSTLSRLLLTLVSLAVAVRAADRPNVLLICVDDLKPILGAYGNKTALTPAMDRLASRGTIFDRAYCNQAVCAPSRNALLTGKRPQTVGIYDLGTNFRKATPDAVTLPQFFKQQGYRTEGLGKIFHVGHGNVEDPASWSVPHWPIPVIAYHTNDPSGDLTREEALFANRPARGLKRGPAFEAADVPDDGYPDGRLAAEAIRRLDAAKAKPETPFFLAVGFAKPHLPFCAPKKYWDLYDPAKFTLAERTTPPDGAPRYAPTNWGEVRQYEGIPDNGPLPPDMQRKLIHGYYAATSYADAQIGRLLDALEKSGLAEKTIVVLWGDHGWHLGDNGMWSKHSNYEQANRIPLIVVAPGVAKPGTRSAAPVESVDLYPTLVELTGHPLPATGLDGMSLKPILQDPAKVNKEAVFHVFPRGRRGEQVVGRAVRTARYRLVEWKVPGAAADTADLELYDYETDPAETKNLAETKPEVVAELRKILAAQPEAKPQHRN